MKLIVITVLGVLLLASIGAATSGATTGTASPQPAQSVYLFDVPATAEHGGGTLMIDHNQHRFVFEGKGQPGKAYYLQYTLKNRPGTYTFALATASPSGTLHMEGVWTKKFGSWATKLANLRSSRALSFADGNATTPSGNESETLTEEPTFELSAAPPEEIAGTTIHVFSDIGLTCWHFPPPYQGYSEMTPATVEFVGRYITPTTYTLDIPSFSIGYGGGDITRQAFTYVYSNTTQDAYYSETIANPIGVYQISISANDPSTGIVVHSQTIWSFNTIPSPDVHPVTGQVSLESLRFRIVLSLDEPHCSQ